MNFIEEFEKTKSTIENVFSNKKYLLISIVSGIALFSILYYFIVAKIADNSLRIAIMMSGAGYITWSVTLIFLTSLFFGIYLSLLVFKVSSSIAIGGKSVVGAIGAGIAGFGVGCPTCGAVLFTLIGAPLALMYLPFKGVELQVLGVAFLLVSIYFVSNSISGVCKVKY